MIINEIIDRKIKPNTNSAIDDAIPILREFLEKNCSQILKEYRQVGIPLYRGMRAISPIFIGNPRTDRLSQGLPQDVHKLLIKCFQLVGFKATREKTISCISNLKESLLFVSSRIDKVYVIFPLNGFSYTWSTQHSDIGMLGFEPSKIKFIYQYEDELGIKANNQEEKAEQVKIAQLVIDELGFTDKNLNQALISGHEVAIAGKYIAIQKQIYDTKMNLGI